METARLLAARPRPEDAEGLASVLAEPAVGDWLWPGDLGGPRTAEQTAAIVARDVEAWDRDGWGPWIVRDRATGGVLGRAGLARTRIEDRSVIEVAWLLTSARWGEGLATEAAREGIRAGFDDLGLDELVAIALVENRASRAVMRKLGMVEEREIAHAGLPHVLARLRRPPAPAGPRR